MSLVDLVAVYAIANFVISFSFFGVILLNWEGFSEMKLFDKLMFGYSSFIVTSHLTFFFFAFNYLVLIQ